MSRQWRYRSRHCQELKFSSPEIITQKEMIEMGSQEIIAVPGNGEISSVDLTDDIISSAERRVEKIKKIITLALKITNHQDWVDQQGKPYLQGSGAEKVARLFGLKIHSVKVEKKETSDEKGQFYYYLTTGVAEMKGGLDSLVAIGTCSSKDQFFAKTKDADGNPVWKPLSEVDETNIMKSSYTNFLVNGITRLLGLRNLTYEQLQEAGIDISKLTKVEYNKTPETEDITAKRQELAEMILMLANNDGKVAEDILEKESTFTAKDGKVVKGKRSLKELSPKMINWVYSKIKKQFPSKPVKENANG